MKNQIAETGIVLSVVELYEYLQQQQSEQIGLLQGKPGTGKTTAAHYCANEYNGVFIKAIPGWSRYQMCRSILKEIAGMKARSFSECMELITEDLSRTRRALFVDEADFLCENKDNLEILRTIHDLAGIPLILVGMEGLEPKLRSLPQFHSRIQVEYRAKGLTRADARRFVDTLCDVGISDDLLDVLFKAADATPRRIKTALINIEQHCAFEGIEQISLAQWGNRNFWANAAYAPARDQIREVA